MASAAGGDAWGGRGCVSGVGHKRKAPESAVFGEGLSDEERSDARKALSRLSISVDEHRRQGDVKDDEFVFVVVGYDLVALRCVGFYCVAVCVCGVFVCVSMHVCMHACTYVCMDVLSARCGV